MQHQQTEQQTCIVLCMHLNGYTEDKAHTNMYRNPIIVYIYVCVYVLLYLDFPIKPGCARVGVPLFG